MEKAIISIYIIIILYILHNVRRSLSKNASSFDFKRRSVLIRMTKRLEKEENTPKIPKSFQNSILCLHRNNKNELL